MRKWLLAGLGLLLCLLFVVNAEAREIENETEASGTSVVRINELRGSYKVLYLRPWTQDVIASVYSSGSVVETYTVQAGLGRNIRIAGKDSVQVARATATVLDWSISADDKTSYTGSSSAGFFSAISDTDGLWSSPDLTTTVIPVGDIDAGDSVDVELGDLSGYWEVYVKFLATTFDTATVYVATSENLGWDTGNTAYFDRDPGTVTIDAWSLDDGLGAYGTCIPLMNTYGAFLPGKYGLLRIKADAGDDTVALTVIVIKRK